MMAASFTRLPRKVTMSQIEGDVRDHLSWIKENEAALILLVSNQFREEDLEFVSKRVDYLLLQGYQEWLPRYLKVAKGKVDEDGKLVLSKVLNPFLKKYLDLATQEGGIDKLDEEQFWSLVNGMKAIDADEWMRDVVVGEEYKKLVNTLEKEVRDFRGGEPSSKLWTIYGFYSDRTMRRFEANDETLDLLEEVRVADRFLPSDVSAQRFFDKYLAQLKQDGSYATADTDKMKYLLHFLQEHYAAEPMQAGVYLRSPMNQFYSELDVIVKENNGESGATVKVIYEDYARRLRSKIEKSDSQGNLIEAVRMGLNFKDNMLLTQVLGVMGKRRSPADLQLLGEILDSDYLKQGDLDVVTPLLEHLQKREEKEVVWLVAGLLEHKNEKVRRKAHAFLVKRVGEDQGSTVKAWRDWYGKE